MLDEVPESELQLNRQRSRVELDDPGNGTVHRFCGVNVTVAGYHDQGGAKGHHEPVLRIEPDLGPAELQHRLELPCGDRSHGPAVGIDADELVSPSALHLQTPDRPVPGDDHECAAEGHHEPVLRVEPDSRSRELQDRGELSLRTGTDDVAAECAAVRRDHDECVAESHHEFVLRVETDLGAPDLEHRLKLPVHNIGAKHAAVRRNHDECVAESHHEPILRVETDLGAAEFEYGLRLSVDDVRTKYAAVISHHHEGVPTVIMKRSSGLKPIFT